MGLITGMEISVALTRQEDSAVAQFLFFYTS
jgi:hypothetical protein